MRTDRSLRRLESGVAQSRAANVGALDRATREIQRLKKRIVESSYRLGVVLIEVLEKKLYAVRHRSFNDYLANEAAIAKTTAYRYVTLARTFRPEVVSRHGSAKLLEALDFIAETPQDEEPEDIPSLEIPVRRKGKTKLVPFGEASAREIAEARKRVVARRDSPKERAWYHAFVAGTRAKLDRAQLDRVTIVVDPPRRDGSHTISIEGVKPETVWRTLSILANVARAVAR